jgi:hypothetical protein
MAGLKEYFKTDLRPLVRLEAQWSALLDDGSAFEFESCALLDPTAGVRYLAFYLSSKRFDELEFIQAIDQAEYYLDKANNVSLGRPHAAGVQVAVTNHGNNRASLRFDWPGDNRQLRDADLQFTGRIYFYHESSINPRGRRRLEEYASRKKLTLIFRGTEYAAERDVLERPRAFISHDSRDKEAIARKIAMRLRDMHCPVWYDEFSLTVGDSLRESIEAGLKQCHMCIFILTTNFLSKGGWPKREYDAIFTRELVEDKRLILPVWAGVTKQEIYEYSPVLADRVALHWEQGEDKVCRKLYDKLMHRR